MLLYWYPAVYLTSHPPQTLRFFAVFCLYTRASMKTLLHSHLLDMARRCPLEGQQLLIRNWQLRHFSKKERHSKDLSFSCSCKALLLVLVWWSLVLWDFRAVIVSKQDALTVGMGLKYYHQTDPISVLRGTHKINGISEAWVIILLRLSRKGFKLPVIQQVKLPVSQLKAWSPS